MQGSVLKVSLMLMMLNRKTCKDKKDSQMDLNDCIIISQYKVNGAACIVNRVLGPRFKNIPAQYENRERLRYYVPVGKNFA